MFRTKIENLFSHQGFKKYFKNTSWLMAEKVFRMLVGLFVGIWVARYLGPEQFGLLSYAQSFVGLFMAFSTLGLDSIVVRELVKNEQSKDVLLGTAFILKLIGGGIIFIVLAIATKFTSNDSYTNALVYIIASAVIFQSFNVIDFFFQSQVLSKYVVFANVITLFISSGIKIYLILTNAPLIVFAWMVLFDSIILALGFIYFFSNHSSLFKWKFNVSTAINFLKDSWPISLSGVVIAIYMKIDQVMIKVLLDHEAVGIYAAAVRISESWYFIPTVITASLFPAIIKAKKTNESTYLKRLKYLYVLVGWISILIALFFSFFSHDVMVLLYGHAYELSGTILIVHIWSGFNVAIGLTWSKWILLENQQRLALYGHILGAILNVIFNWFLILEFKALGAAIATLASYWISAIVVYALYKPSVSYNMIMSIFNLKLLHNGFKERFG